MSGVSSCGGWCQMSDPATHLCRSPQLLGLVLWSGAGVGQARDCNGISKLTLIQLIIPYLISCISVSSEIPLLSLGQYRTAPPSTHMCRVHWHLSHAHPPRSRRPHIMWGWHHQPGHQWRSESQATAHCSCNISEKSGSFQFSECNDWILSITMYIIFFRYLFRYF